MTVEELKLHLRSEILRIKDYIKNANIDTKFGEGTLLIKEINRLNDTLKVIESINFNVKYNSKINKI